jgi:hypothetical protein
MRRNLQRRFMKLYRIYRYKKYGEPYDKNQTTWTVHEKLEDYDYPQ